VSHQNGRRFGADHEFSTPTDHLRHLLSANEVFEMQGTAYLQPTPRCCCQMQSVQARHECCLCVMRPFGSRARRVTPDEITAAEKHGVVLQLVTSKTLGAQYVANVCPRCKAFVGNHFMLNYMDWKADAVCWGICSGRNASLVAESPCDKSQLRMFDEA